jgi:hypothetical protein
MTSEKLQSLAQAIAVSLRDRLGSRESRIAARKLLSRCFKWEEEGGTDAELAILIEALETCDAELNPGTKEAGTGQEETPRTEPDLADQLTARYDKKPNLIGDRKHHEGLIPWLDESLERQEAFKSRIDWLVERSETAAESLGQTTRVRAADELAEEGDNRDSFELLVTKPKKKPPRR